jgi:sugar phosphate isomerase/epimerase
MSTGRRTVTRRRPPDTKEHPHEHTVRPALQRARRRRGGPERGRRAPRRDRLHEGRALRLRRAPRRDRRRAQRRRRHRALRPRGRHRLEQIGLETVIDPFIPSDRWQTADDAARIAERVNELTAQAASHGLRFGYHNHQWEFTNEVDGRPIYHSFVEQLSPEVVLELDTFWATVGGQDTPALLRQLGDRVQFLHIKDGKVSGDIATALPSSESALVVPDALKAAFENQTPAGQGDVDVRAILEAAPHALRVVEFDAYSGDVFAGIAESFAWLKENDTTQLDGTDGVTA